MTDIGNGHQQSPAFAFAHAGRLAVHRIVKIPGVLTINRHQWHVGQGRLLPTTSVDQLAATLGRWFGATDAELRLVLPNLRNFGGTQAGISYPVDLGFMA